ncbi:MAG: RHS repeat protein [Bdellovibrionales bacterium]|nr:RHS repeat protein [Bdellovibrionales bacterium]
MHRQKSATRSLGIFAAALLLGAAAPALANVSLRNGNFFIGYTDIIYPGGFEPKIERVYNSKSGFRGIFGWGWGTEYEVHLKVAADGSVVAHEYGGGAENRFSPVAFNQAQLQGAADEIAAAAQKAGAVGSAGQLADLKKRLLGDARFRNQEWEKYIQRGLLKPRQLPAGTQLTSNRFSYQYITKVKDGYVRSYDNGRVEQFAENGRLLKISDKNNNFIQISYSKDGKADKIVDNFNRKMFLTYNAQGNLVKIQGENGKEAAYTYGSRGELLTSKDVDGNTYAYTYDKIYNLTQVKYKDGTSMDIAYLGRDQNDSVRSVKDRDGTRTDYTYDWSKKETGFRSVGVKVLDKDGKRVISQSGYEYHLKRKASGEEWTYKMVTTIDGDRSETIYNECCGLPLMIKRGGEETTFEYDTKGHVTKKTTPTETTVLAYDPKLGKVTKVMRQSKVSKASSSWSEFQYDGKGNLVFAKNSTNKGVRLFYDANGRIKSMVDQDRRRIDFKYNENSKPVEITDPQLGTIRVSYSNSGEIKKVESTAGRKIALQVTSAFQNLLDIIRPAGVSLSF